MAAVRAALATGNGIRRAEVLSNRATDRAEDAPGPKLAELAQAKVRGRNRITGNRSARSRPLAPSQPPPRIAIASDVPPRGRKIVDLGTPPPNVQVDQRAARLQATGEASW